MLLLGRQVGRWLGADQRGRRVQRVGRVKVRLQREIAGGPKIEPLSPLLGPAGIHPRAVRA